MTSARRTNPPPPTSTQSTVEDSCRWRSSEPDLRENMSWMLTVLFDTIRVSCLSGLSDIRQPLIDHKHSDWLTLYCLIRMSSRKSKVHLINRHYDDDDKTVMWIRWKKWNENTSLLLVIIFISFLSLFLNPFELQICRTTVMFFILANSLQIMLTCTFMLKCHQIIPHVKSDFYLSYSLWCLITA